LEQDSALPRRVAGRESRASGNSVLRVCGPVVVCYALDVHDAHAHCATHLLFTLFCTGTNRSDTNVGALGTRQLDALDIFDTAESYDEYRD